MDFREVDRRYVDLKRQYDNGNLGAEAFDEQLEAMMVQDDRDRWWAKSRETGEWHYYDGSTWVRDTPPEPNTAEEPPPVQQTSVRSLQQPPAPERPGLWVGWGIAITVVGLFVGVIGGLVGLLIGLLLLAVGLYCGYKAVQKGGVVGGLVTAAISGVFLLFGLLALIGLTL